jgi:glycosyltransferase involved in cell wall biosynthesis
MRILHATANPGNQSMKMALAQRKLGHQSDCWISDKAAFSLFGADRNLRFYEYPRFLRQVVAARELLRAASRYDVFHFHSHTFSPWMWDIPVLKWVGKTVVMHYHGIRLICLKDPVRARQLHGVEYRGRANLYASIADRLAKRFANALLVSTPDLLPYAPTAQWVPQPTDLEYWRRSHPGPLNQSEVTIAHAPSTKFKKGTKYVQQAVEQLKDEGYNIRLDVIHDVPYAQVRERVEAADIFVDQLLAGWYGNATCEAMALELPVLVYIRDDLLSYLDGCPVVCTTLQTLADDLRRLISDGEERWRELGQLGRKYVEEVHDMVKIGQEMIELYETLRQRGEGR